jgi:hypothetical protein
MFCIPMEMISVTLDTVAAAVLCINVDVATTVGEAVTDDWLTTILVVASSVSSVTIEVDNDKLEVKISVVFVGTVAVEIDEVRLVKDTWVERVSVSVTADDDKDVPTVDAMKISVMISVSSSAVDIVIEVIVVVALLTWPIIRQKSSTLSVSIADYNMIHYLIDWPFVV